MQKIIVQKNSSKLGSLLARSSALLSAEANFFCSRLTKMILFTLSLFLFASCVAHYSNHAVIEGYDTGNRNNGEGLAIKSFRMLPLEALPECMLGNPSKVEVLDSLIFIHDNNSLHVFDTNGKFLNHIGRRGNGHSEYINLSSFCIDKEGYVLLIDSYKSNILKYTYSGSFVEQVNIPEGVLANVHNAALIGRDSLFISEYLYNASHILYSIIDLNSGTKTIVADTPLQTANTMESVGVHSFSQYNGKIRYIKPLDNVIYSLTSNDEFEISTTQQVFSEKELSEIKDFSINTYATNMANNIFCGFSDIFETEKYIILSLKNLEYTVIDKQLSTCRRYSYKIDSEDTNLPLYEIACSNSNILVGILTPVEIQHLKENAKNSLVSRAINRLNVSDILSTNCIVLFYET